MLQVAPVSGDARMGPEMCYTVPPSIPPLPSSFLPPAPNRECMQQTNFQGALQQRFMAKKSIAGGSCVRGRQDGALYAGLMLSLFSLPPVSQSTIACGRSDTRDPCSSKRCKAVNRR